MCTLGEPSLLVQELLSAVVCALSKAQEAWGQLAHNSRARPQGMDLADTSEDRAVIVSLKVQ